MLRSLFVLFLAAAIPACSIVAATRAPAPELGAVACRNLVDDDLDGLLDCDDTECDGNCPEEELEACTDERDNDGDGVIDGDDARCWHLAPPSVKRCATVRGSFVSPVIDEGTLAWRGVADLVPDPRDATRRVLTARGEEFRIAPAATTTGALDGLVLSATLLLSRDVETSIALVPAGELGDATTVAVFSPYVRFVVGRDVHLESNAGSSERLAAPPALSAPTWTEVVLTIRGRTVTATLATNGGRPMDAATLPLPAAMADPAALDVLVTADSEPIAGVPSLAGLSIERSDLPTCESDELVPEMHAPGLDLILDVALGGESGETRCAITSDSGAGRPYVAERDAAWSRVSTALGTDDVIGAAIAWDATRGAFVGILAHGADVVGGREPSDFSRIESPDCRAWTIDPWALPALDPGLQVTARGIAYDVDESGSHAVRFVTSRDGSIGILTLVSSSGEPGSITMESLREVGPDASRLVTEYLGTGLTLVGRDDLVILAATGRGLVALTPRGSSGRFIELPTSLLPPSQVEGTFDRGMLIGPPRILPSSDGARSRIFYGGTTHGECYACVASGSALFTTRSEQ